VIWRLKAGMVESEKTAIGRQQLVRYVPTAANYHDIGFGIKLYPWRQLLKRQKDSTEALEGRDI
jgi:hypothetical protein